MGVTGRRLGSFAWIAATMLAVSPARADRAADVLTTVNHVATALTSNDTPDAMTAFSKSFRESDKLSGYFSGLMGRGELVNEVDVVEEQDSPSETSLIVQWTLLITNYNDPADTDRRTERVRIRLALEGNVWKIANLSPLEFFNPARRTASK